MAINLSDSIQLLAREAYARRAWMVGGFAAIALIGALIGMTWPKTYTSASTVYVEDQSVIAPLLEGAAVSSQLRDRALIAREVIYGRRILTQVVRSSGWKLDLNDAVVMDGIVEGIKKRTLVTNVGENLVKIEYTDTDPMRARAVAQKLADLFVSETIDAKSRESASAFSFIDQQVREYQAKLRRLQENLKNFRNSNADAEPGAEVDVAHRITELKDRLVQLDQDLREASIRKQSIESQLSGEARVSTIASRTEQYRTRIGELRTRLDNLRLTYHDSYPDIVSLKAQIKELEAAADAEEKLALNGSVEADKTASGVTSNPLYQELHGGLYETNTALQTVRSRIDDTKRMLRMEEERSRRIQSMSAQLTEMTRDYDVNNTLYQELLRRREAARVSLSLNRTQGGVSIRVEEPAHLPRSYAGPSPLLIVVGGMVLGVLLPLGTLFAVQQSDPRVRHPSVITERLGLPVLGVIRHLHTPRETTAELRSLFSLGMALVATIAVIALLGAVRIMGGI